MRRSFFIGVVVALLFGGTVLGQPVNPQIQIAINNLINGITTFQQLGMNPDTYISWGTPQGTSGYGLRDNSGVIEVKNDGGAWTPITASSGAPNDASYWVRTANGSLTNETVMGALGTGLIINVTTTGVPIIYSGTSCTNQFPRSINPAGAATCSSVSLTADTTGTLTVAKGGTGLTTGTSGGVLYFSASGTLASSGALTANRLVVGGGAGVAPSVVGGLGTTTQVLHGNASGAPTFGSVVLTTDVSGILPAANGGTANGFFAVTGPTTSTKTFTFPNASATVLTSNAAVTPAQGGTGITSYAVGDLIYASGTTTLAKLADVATGNAVISGGVGTAPAWGKIGLTTHISGTLGPTNGGTGLASYTTGDLIYANSGISLASRAAVATGSVLISQGVATAPVWSTAAQLTAISLGSANLTFSGATPTISSGFGTTPSVTAGTAAAFRVNVGTGGSATAGVIGLPTAATGWNCAVENLTGTTANVMDQRTVQLSSTTTTATIENQTVSTGAALAWTASDILAVSCIAF
jgi:hypothetical protein